MVIEIDEKENFLCPMSFTNPVDQRYCCTTQCAWFKILVVRKSINKVFGYCGKTGEPTPEDQQRVLD